MKDINIELTMEEAQTILLALERESYAFMEGHQKTGEAFFLDSLKRCNDIIDVIAKKIVQKDEQASKQHAQEIQRLLGYQYL